MASDPPKPLPSSPSLPKNDDEETSNTPQLKAHGHDQEHPTSAFPFLLSFPTPQPQQQSHQHNFLTTYRTFGLRTSAMGSPEEQQPLLQNDPESMGGEPGQSGVSGGGSARGTLRKWISVVVFFIIGLVIGVMAVAFIHPNRPHWHSSRPCPGRNHPTGRLYRNPIDAPPAYGEQLAWEPEPSCNVAERRLPSRFFPVVFDGSLPLNIMQTVTMRHHDSHWQSNIWGDLIVRPVEGDAEPGITVEAITNDDSLGDEINISFDKRNEQVLSIGVPESIPWHTQDRPCVQMRVTLWVPDSKHHPELHSLVLNTTALDISLLQGLNLKVHSGTLIETVVGRVRAASSSSLDSRDIVIRTVSENVDGSWPLYDSLGIYTASGDVTATIALQPMLEDKPRPANLEVKSASGTVKLTEPLAHVNSNDKTPDRDYKVIVETKSGRIVAELAFSTLAMIGSVSGEMDLTLLPVFGVASEGPIRMKIETMSGHIKSKIHNPLWADKSSYDFEAVHQDMRRNPASDLDHGGKDGIDRTEVDEEDFEKWALYYIKKEQAHRTFRPLYSKHQSLSGDLYTVFPSSWRGVFSAETLSGNIKIQGKGVDYDPNDSLVGKIVKGGKGEDRENGSSAKFETASGDIEFVVED